MWIQKRYVKIKIKKYSIIKWKIYEWSALNFS
jgi:hypothetical protein